MPADASDYWVQTTSHDHAFIDRTTTRIEDTLTAHGYDVDSEIVYVKLANEIASNRTSTTTLAARRWRRRRRSGTRAARGRQGAGSPWSRPHRPARPSAPFAGRRASPR